MRGIAIEACAMRLLGVLHPKVKEPSIFWVDRDAVPHNVSAEHFALTKVIAIVHGVGPPFCIPKMQPVVSKAQW